MKLNLKIPSEGTPERKGLRLRSAARFFFGFAFLVLILGCADRYTEADLANACKQSFREGVKQGEVNERAKGMALGAEKLEAKPCVK